MRLVLCVCCVTVYLPSPSFLCKVSLVNPSFEWGGKNVGTLQAHNLNYFYARSQACGQTLIIIYDMRFLFFFSVYMLPCKMAQARESLK